jgi:hypothetical protein
MMMLLTSAGRKPATNDAESAALLKTMLAVTGKVTLDGDTFTTIPDVSRNETLTGQRRVRYFKLDGDRLSVRTPEQSSVIVPGNAWWDAGMGAGAVTATRISTHDGRRTICVISERITGSV